jgi:hypothetical protein
LILYVTEVSMLASYTAAPRRGYMEAVLHLFAYIDKHTRIHLVFDDSYVRVLDEVEVDWIFF